MGFKLTTDRHLLIKNLHMKLLAMQPLLFNKN